MQHLNNSEKQNTEIAKVFGIISLVIAIFSFIFSFIPCVGYYAIGPAVFAILFSIAPFLILKKAGRKIGIPLASLIISLVAVSIGTYQYITYKEVFEKKDEINESFEEANKKFEEAVTKMVIDSLEYHTKKVNDSINETENDSIEW